MEKEKKYAINKRVQYLTIINRFIKNLFFEIKTHPYD